MVSYIQLPSYNTCKLLNNFWNHAAGPQSSSPAPCPSILEYYLPKENGLGSYLCAVPCLPNKPKQQTKTTTTSNENQKLKNMIMTRR